MDFSLDELKRTLQDHFTDGLVTIVGSGLSSSEGIPGMRDLAKHLSEKVPALLSAADISLWQQIDGDLKAGHDLESVLIKNHLSASLEATIVAETARCLLAAEKVVVEDVIVGRKVLQFSKLLKYMLKPNTGIPVITTNYDRLIEIASEAAGLAVDELFVGQNIGRFDPKESEYSLCRNVIQRRTKVYLSYTEHVVVMKPHGSLDWFLKDEDPIRCPFDIGAPRLIITPGINKFRGGYNRPFDAHRERANREIDRAGRFFIVGYSFSDDHLQTHLERQLKGGKPAILLTRTLSKEAIELLATCPGLMALCSIEGNKGTKIYRGTSENRIEDRELWNLSGFVKEVFES